MTTYLKSKSFYENTFQIRLGVAIEKAENENSRNNEYLELSYFEPLDPSISRQVRH